MRQTGETFQNSIVVVNDHTWVGAIRHAATAAYAAANASSWGTSSATSNADDELLRKKRRARFRCV
jgi:hypothetical protein